MENVAKIIFVHACLYYEALQLAIQAGDQTDLDYFNGVVDGLCWALGATTGEKKEEARKRVVKASRAIDRSVDNGIR